MSKKNERYSKGLGVGEPLNPQRANVKLKNNMDDVDSRSSRLHGELKVVQGQEVTMKEKKPFLKSMPKKPLKTKPKLQKFPIMKKMTKKEKLAGIKIRLLQLKYVCKWEQKTFGKISPAKARQQYNLKILKKSFQQWEDVWWNGRNEWKLNIRADYHNRFRMWLKVWRGWRSFLILQKVKKTKMNVAKKKSDQLLLAKSLAIWKTYVGQRRKKQQLRLGAQEDGKMIVKRMAFSKWKNCLKFKQELHAMEEQALHFWAHNLFYKAWQRWLLEYSSTLKEKQRVVFAVQLYNRRLARKMLRSFKLYQMQRKLKNLRLLSGIRFHRLQKLHHAFCKWKITLSRKVELMQFEDTSFPTTSIPVNNSSNNTTTAASRTTTTAMTTGPQQQNNIQCSLTRTKDISLCQAKRQNEWAVLLHFQTRLKLKCIKALQKRVEVQKRTALFRVTATTFYKIALMRRVWTLWLTACEDREDLRQIRLIKFVRSHYRKRLLIKVVGSWKFYCERKRFKQIQKLKADITARRNTLPRLFTRWQIFVDLVKTRRLNQESAEEFRRECLLAKTFYRWLQEYRLTLDIQMLYRMAIISYDEKVKKGFFRLWLTKTRQRIRENMLMERSHHHYQLQLKKKCVVTWREYIECRNYGSVRLNMAVKHRNTKLLSMCWKCWAKFVAKKRKKWKLVITADLHFRQGILRKSLEMWKLYCNDMKEIKLIAEEKKTSYDKKALRFLFECWRGNARYLKITRRNYHISSQHWEIKTTKKVFVAWRDYTELRLWKKQNKLSKITEVRKLLDQGKLRRTLQLWREEYLLNISFKNKWTRATEHWKRCVLRKTFDILKKYRFLGYRKQVLRQQCMLFHNERIVASHWIIWRSRYAERGMLLKKSHMALWLWSLTLQRKVFLSWFYYAEEKRKKKEAINEALERRRQWLHKVAVTRWIKFATHSIAERERFAVCRHVQISQNVQRSVQRCAIHWRRKTIKNRDKRREVARLNRQLPFNTNTISHKKESKGHTSKTLSRTFVQHVPTVRRPQPRVPDYLRESFNLSELSEHISSSVADAEDIPRNLPSNFQPTSQPERLPEPTVYTSSITSRTSSNTSQTGFKEVTPLKGSSRNPKEFPLKVGSSAKPVLLPPSSFVQTKRFVKDGPRYTQEYQKVTEGQAEKGVKSSFQEVQNGSQSAHTVRTDINPTSDAISTILSDRNSQQSIVQLRDRMLKYYTISTHLRDLRRRLTDLRQWSRGSKENDAKLREEELSLVKELVTELSENVAITSDSLEQSYRTITNDLQELLDKVS